MPVNWGMQQFQPNTRLNLAPVRQGLANMQTAKTQRNLADMTLKKEERIENLKLERQDRVNRFRKLDGSFDLQGMGQDAFRGGDTEHATQIGSRLKTKQNELDRIESKFVDENNKHIKIYNNLPDEDAKIQYYTNDYSPFIQKSNKGVLPHWSLRADERLRAMGKEPLTQDQQNKRDQKIVNDKLDFRFRKEFLPSLQRDIANVASDENARNKLVYRIENSPYANSPAAQRLLKNVKGKGTNLAEQMLKVMNQSDIAETRLTQKEMDALGALEPALGDLTNLMGLRGKGSTGSLGSELASAASSIPLFGKRMFPKEAGYNKHKRVMVEKFLRAATGAAAPDSEVETYMDFLPTWGEPIDNANDAVKSFLGHVESKARTSVSRLKTVGTKTSMEKANRIEENIDTMITKTNIMLGFEKPPENPKPFSNRDEEVQYLIWEKEQDRLDSIKNKGSN